jgi:hypothetical protein
MLCTSILGSCATNVHPFADPGSTGQATSCYLFAGLFSIVKEQKKSTIANLQLPISCGADRDLRRRRQPASLTCEGWRGCAFGAEPNNPLWS